MAESVGSRAAPVAALAGPPPPGLIGGTRVVPEFDPSVAGSIALLLGAGTVLLARRSR
jgi:hypothetical protein